MRKSLLVAGAALCLVTLGALSVSGPAGAAEEVPNLEASTGTADPAEPVDTVIVPDVGVEDPAVGEDPVVGEDPAVVDDPVVGQDPSVVEDPSSVDDPTGVDVGSDEPASPVVTTDFPEVPQAPAVPEVEETPIVSIDNPLSPCRVWTTPVITWERGRVSRPSYWPSVQCNRWCSYAPWWTSIPMRSSIAGRFATARRFGTCRVCLPHAARHGASGRSLHCHGSFIHRPPVSRLKKAVARRVFAR